MNENDFIVDEVWDVVSIDDGDFINDFENEVMILIFEESLVFEVELVVMGEGSVEMCDLMMEF